MTELDRGVMGVAAMPRARVAPGRREVRFGD